MIFLYEPISSVVRISKPWDIIFVTLPGNCRASSSESHNNTRSGATVCDSKQYSVSARVPNRGLYEVSETMTSFWRP